jgi:UDP-3-O-[3-hydroxymyristoyl] glucosamine N-acyltransferase
MAVSVNYSLPQLAELIGADLHGEPASAVQIVGIAPIDNAVPGTISFLHHARYQKYLATTRASAMVVSKDLVGQCSKPALVCADPYLAYAKLASLFSQLPEYTVGIHRSAVVAEECHIDPTASIGAHVVIERGVVIGKNTVIGSGCVIGAGVSIGHDCRLWANVTLYYDVKLENNVQIHSGTVIGSDGFGYAHDGEIWIKIAQLGAVHIHDNVEIGSNTTIDRGALGDTVIGKGVKLDNHIQVGHNVTIGEGSIIAGCTGISGSVKIGKRCRISGMVGFTGHFEIADDVVITGMTMVSKSLDKPGVYSSGTVIEPHQQWRKNAVRFRQLDEMSCRLRKLEKKMAERLPKDGRN